MPEPDGDEVVELVVGSDDEAPAWWSQYERAIRRGGISDTSIEAISADSAYIVDECVYAESANDERTRTGLVMGAVQSGKTASMLAVSARSLDAGMDVIVILAGTRLALWRQTYQRSCEQVFNPDSPSHHLLPSRDAAMDPEADVRLDRLYALNTHKAKRLLATKSPLVLIVMKNVHHIHAAAEMLHESVYPHLDSLRRTVRLLVLDDEADDGSILDALVERGLDPNADALKQVPRHIAGLWGRHGSGPETVHDQLLATYVAYTATPQANLLQADQNPLAPRDFIAALRTPGPAGSLTPRESAYRDNAGLKRWYTGGEIFHRTLGRTALMISGAPPGPTPADDHGARLAQISRALRAYLVAGAIRLWRDSATYPGEVLFATREAARAASPAPHTMLFHPSALVADHFAAAAEILQVSRGLDVASALRTIHDEDRALSTGHLEADLQTDPDRWRSWLAEYRETGLLVRDHFGLAPAEAASLPTDDDWGAIEQLLVEQVIPNTRISIVNSDPAADDRPEFEPIEVEGGWRAAPDLATIFVSGNVMARGLTLEGLSTTLFLRSSGDPVADTQQQMQRWFGYRGGYVELCRVFLPRGQRELFEQYHEADEALRRQIVGAMNSEDGAPRPSVLEGERFHATGKLSGLNKIPLCPSSAPLVRFISEQGGTEANLERVGGLAARAHTAVIVGGTYRGHLLNESLSLLEAAELLEGLTYHGYSPDPEDSLVSRWLNVEAQLGIGPESPAPLFRRPPLATEDATSVQPLSCPYTVAAYLRLWAACLTRHARGLFPTEDGTTPWTALDLTRRAAAQPRFWVGFRSGSASSVTGPGFDELDPPLALMKRTVEDGELRAGWGGRSDSDAADKYLGDLRFDHHLHPEQPEPVLAGGTRWRPPGADGLVLFMPVRVEDKLPVFAVGVAIPLGGPDQIAASRTGMP